MKKFMYLLVGLFFLSNVSIVDSAYAAERKPVQGVLKVIAAVGLRMATAVSGIATVAATSYCLSNRDTQLLSIPCFLVGAALTVGLGYSSIKVVQSAQHDIQGTSNFAVPVHPV